MIFGLSKSTGLLLEDDRDSGSTVGLHVLACKFCRALRFLKDQLPICELDHRFSQILRRSNSDRVFDPQIFPTGRVQPYRPISSYWVFRLPSSERNGGASKAASLLLMPQKHHTFFDV